jgi:hypothetical protein
MREFWYVSAFFHIRGIASCSKDAAYLALVVSVRRSDKRAGGVVNERRELDG